MRTRRAEIAIELLTDKRVLSMAHAIARIRSANPLPFNVEVDMMWLTLNMLEREGLPFDDSMRQCPAEQARLTKIAVNLGLVEKLGRGRKARYVLTQGGPSVEDIAAVLRADLRSQYRVEALWRELVTKSDGLALLGLEGERAADYLRRMCSTSGTGWTLDHLAGAERVRIAA